MNTLTSEESEGSLAFTAYLKDGPTTLPVVADIGYDRTSLILQGNVTQSATGAFVANFKTRTDLREGNYNGQMQFRLCAEAACDTVYPGSIQQFSYVMTVQLKDWSTFQGNPSHTGYARLVVDAPKITKLWEHNNTISVSKLAADRDRVYFTTGNSMGSGSPTASIRALKMSDGTVDWNYDLGSMAYIGDPAIAAGRVFVSSMVISSSNNPITILDATTGTHRATGAFASQWATFLAATPTDDDIYTASGYYGNVVYSHRQSDGTQRWSSSGSGGNVTTTATPAVNNSHVYYYTGAGLDAFNRTDGSRIFTIPDPYQAGGGYDYGGSPAILNDGSVLAFSGTTYSSNSFGPVSGLLRPLVRYLPQTRSIAWRTADAYFTQPAARGDLVFAARNSPARLDAINVSDGKVAWSWTPPANVSSPTPVTFHGSVLVTDNVVFVSTNQKVYGISLTDQSVVWSYDKPGVLAIAPGNVLLVAESDVGTFSSNGRISAFMLRLV